MVSICAAVTISAAEPGADPPTTAEPAAATGAFEDRFHAPDGQARVLIETLLEGNPQIRSTWARSQARFERVDQARSLPDMQLGYTYFASTPETRVGPQSHRLEFSQGVPWGGKRKLQARREETLASGATWEAADLERRLVAELKRAYFEAAYLQEALMINSEERELLRRFESIALKRYSTGEGIQQSVVKVQTDISRLDDRQTDLQERLDAVARRLSELIGRPDEPLDLEPIELSLPELRHEREDLERAAVSEHPRVHAVERRVEADLQWAKRRELEARPDFRFGLGYGFVDDREDPAGVLNPPDDNGKDVLAVTVGIDIPLYRKRIRSGVAEARESQRANEELLVAVRNRLRFDVQEAALRLDSLGERGRLFRDVIIPQAEESLASAEAAYTTNRLGFLDLLDAQRILFQSRLAYHRLVSDLWIALADLELAVGKPVPDEYPPTVDSRHRTTTSGSSS
jgi:outer membrane protein TolC